MTELLQQFHFIRPQWLWALVPLLVLFLLLFRKRLSSQSWTQVISPELLPFLTEGSATSKKNNYLIPVGLGWLLTCLALAGPTWEKLPQPVHRQTDALVIVLDLSLSMLATDLNPSRLVVAQRKLTDLLKLRKEGLTGLVVFSGDAHSVSPLTDDSKTIAALVPALSPEIMPVFGSRLDHGLTEAVKLLTQGGAGKQSRIIVLTDGIHPRSQKQTLKLVEEIEYPISILVVGTSTGAPIPKPDGGFLKDGTGSIVIPKLDLAPLKAISATSGGNFQRLTIDDSDIQRLLGKKISLNSNNSNSTSAQSDEEKTREFDLWVERGPWLLLPLLLLALPAFRRGWIFSLTLLVTLPLATTPRTAQAFEWQDLWSTADQRGMNAMENEQHEQAAELFDNPNWKGSAHFREGKYEEAAEQFSTSDNAQAHYNRGNALAKAGKLEDALSAYDQALEKQPQLNDAQANKKLVADLLKQQQEQEQKQKDEQSESNEDGEPSDDQQGEQSGDQQDNSSEPSDDEQQQNSEPGEQEPDQQGKDQKEPEDSDENEDKSDKEQSEQDKKDEQDAKNKAKQEEQNEGQPKPSEPASSDDQRTEEQRQQDQKTEQMLRRLPDNPGLLFQRKFQQQYLKNKQNRNRQLEANSKEPIW